MVASKMAGKWKGLRSGSCTRSGLALTALTQDGLRSDCRHKESYSSLPRSIRGTGLQNLSILRIICLCQLLPGRPSSTCDEGPCNQYSYQLSFLVSCPGLSIQQIRNRFARILVTLLQHPRGSSNEVHRSLVPQPCKHIG